MDHVQICVDFLFISSNSLDTNKIITNSTMQFMNTEETVIVYDHYSNISDHTHSGSMQLFSCV